MNDVLQPFFKQLSRNPLLTRQEEVELAQMIEHGDKKARDKMIKSNLRLAVSIAKKYQDKGCDLSDLIQESTIGLMKAVDRFDWRRGFKFSTYACWWIKQSIRRHIASQSSVIRVPTYTKTMIWKIKQAVTDYEDEFGQKPTSSELSELLGISCDIIESTLQCNRSYVASFDSPTRYGSDDSRTLADVLQADNLVNPDDEMDKEKVMSAIRDSLKFLTEREEKIVRLRFGITEDPTDHVNFPITQGELSKIQNVRGASHDA